MSDIFNSISDSILQCQLSHTPTLTVNDESVDVLKQYCMFLEKAADVYDCEKVDVSASTAKVLISLYVPEMSLEYSDNAITELIERSNEFIIQNTNNGLLKITFAFPSVFEVA